MTNSIQPKTWYSGNYNPKRFAKEAPYNGIEIVGLPTYDSQTGRFLSASITFTDYTKVQAGSVTLIPELTFSEGQTAILAAVEELASPPQSPPSSPPQPDRDFTIDGWVSLEANGGNFSLRVYLSFGLEHARGAERGYIMNFLKEQAPTA